MNQQDNMAIVLKLSDRAQQYYNDKEKGKDKIAFKMKKIKNN